jgi:hypothetical protein
MTLVPEIIDPVFAKTSQNARFLLSENERFGLVFVKTGSINSGTDAVHNLSDDHLKSASFIYQKLELAVASSSADPARAACVSINKRISPLPPPRRQSGSTL